MKTVMTTIFSVALSSLVLFGQGPWHLFAFYVVSTLTVLCWVAVLALGIDKAVTGDTGKNVWISIPCTAYQLYALVSTGHQVVAAASCIASLLILLQVFSQKAKEKHA
ncbi:hypothetical protein [Pseudomonas multiresinivorans]|uniref:Uncharacterized protein n=1 Tax=Pseudomonas multiresinivorans TaxID=95301 RepID=A0A7Z3BKC0_9PSED|nr:hypothetical protein [Pseudomonas multiresinivorans]QJP08384.1 hypothetical protein G4G71_11045 [Pseudomonas multiresinivorans]QJP10473.1 hypothetical protein G4G71_22245 [Pseudomonas multiresinivorans]